MWNFCHYHYLLFVLIEFQIRYVVDLDHDYNHQNMMLFYFHQQMFYDQHFWVPN